MARRNYPFAGSQESSQRSALVYSLLATCTLHHINPYFMYRGVLENMHRLKIGDIEKLLS